jgi:hypothetical protein
MERFCRTTERVSMGIIHRHGGNGFCEIAENVGKQRKVDVHVNRFPRFSVARPIEQKRNTGGIHVSIEPRRSLKRSAIKLIGVFEHNFGLVGDRFGHGIYRVGYDSGNAFLERLRGEQYDLDQLPRTNLKLSMRHERRFLAAGWWRCRSA